MYDVKYISTLKISKKIEILMKLPVFFVLHFIFFTYLLKKISKINILNTNKCIAIGSNQKVVKNIYILLIINVGIRNYSRNNIVKINR